MGPQTIVIIDSGQLTLQSLALHFPACLHSYQSRKPQKDKKMKKWKVKKEKKKKKEKDRHKKKKETEKTRNEKGKVR